MSDRLAAIEAIVAESRAAFNAMEERLRERMRRATVTLDGVDYMPAGVAKRCIGHVIAARDELYVLERDLDGAPLAEIKRRFDAYKARLQRIEMDA